MKKSITLFGIKSSVEFSVVYRFEVHVHSGEWPVEHLATYPCKTLLGATLKAFILSRDRNKGWSEKMVAIVYDMSNPEEGQKAVCGFQAYMSVIKYKVRFSRF